MKRMEKETLAGPDGIRKGDDNTWGGDIRTVFEVIVKVNAG